MSFSSSDDDSQQRFALGFLFALIALVVSIVVGTVVYKRGIPPRAEARSSSASAGSSCRGRRRHRGCGQCARGGRRGDVLFRVW